MVRIRVPVWSRLTRVQRILLVVVVAIVALYILAVGLGARPAERTDGDGGLAEPPGFVQWMGDVFAGSSRVDPADLTTDCVRPTPEPSPPPEPSATPEPSPSPSPTATPQASPSASPSGVPEPSEPQRDLLVVPQACVLTIAPREGNLRQLTIQGVGAVRVEAPMPREDGTAVKELAAGEEVTVTVDAEGAQIRLACPTAVACTIELK